MARLVIRYSEFSWDTEELIESIVGKGAFVSGTDGKCSTLVFRLETLEETEAAANTVRQLTDIPGLSVEVDKD